MKMETVQDLLLNGLAYVYDAEHQLVEGLPKMAKAASAPELQQAFESHLTETKNHVTRLDQIYQAMGKKPERKSNAVVQAMTKEVEHMIHSTDASPVRDAALIVAGNQAEHYEMAAYGSLRNFAQLLGENKCVALLEQTLEEEKKADQKLTQIGETQVNRQALNAHAHAH